MRKTDPRVVMNIQMMETVFSEIAFDAQNTIKMEPCFVGDLASESSFLGLITECTDALDDILEGAHRNTEVLPPAPLYKTLIELASACLLNAMWMRQRDAPEPETITPLFVERPGAMIN